MDEKNRCIGDDEEEIENIIINEVDGLPSLHKDYQDDDIDYEKDRPDPSARTLDDLIHDEDLPTSVIVTNVDPRVFIDNDAKAEIEGLFREFGKEATFQYFKSFKRMRVNFNTPSSASRARIQLHQLHFGDTDINCYFAQPVTPIDVEDRHLQPPALTKQFLISPPASPPVGWEPRAEGEPLVNHDLLAAIANLSPGESHELHAGGSDQPGIFVHVCENPFIPSAKPTIPHTRCPNH